MENLLHFRLSNLTYTTSDLAYVEMTWTSTLFLSDTCVPENIVRLRSKTLGIFQKPYRDIFAPEFRFIRESEHFQGPCSHLSADKPRVGNLDKKGGFNGSYGYDNF